MLRQVLLVLSCCVIVAVRSQQPCLGAPQDAPHSFAAAPESCDAYIICMGGQTIRGQRCPANMYFEPRTQTCGQSSCMDCSPFGIQNLPHPDSCAQFIRCTMGTREFATCPSDLLFDRTIGNCNYPQEVYCPGQPTYPTDPTDWPTETPCPTDPTYWPPETTTNGWPTDPPWTPEPWPPTTEPPGGDRPVCRGQVFHAHPTDCTRFFMCMDEVLWEHQCPSDLHWNQIRNACDRPENAGCIVRPPGGSTTPPGTPFPPGTEPPLFPPTTEPWYEEADEEAAIIQDEFEDKEE
jgi:hypothetical protein